MGSGVWVTSGVSVGTSVGSGVRVGSFVGVSEGVGITSGFSNSDEYPCGSGDLKTKSLKLLSRLMLRATLFWLIAVLTQNIAKLLMVK